MKAITRTNKNPLVIEYTASQKIYFTAKLVDEITGRETKDGILIQSEYAMSKDRKSKYCLIADIPQKGRKYILKLFAKNKHDSEDEEMTYSMITEFIVIREGDQENIIPRYNLTFDYNLRLTSHFSRYIKLKTNPFVIEFEAPYNNNRRIYFLATLIDEKTGREIENAALIQSEYSMSKDQKSRYCMIIEVPEKWTKYKLKLFASYDDNANTFPFLTDFRVTREGDEECSIPRYNLTFDYDLRLTSHFSRYIKFKTNPLVMEFEAPNKSQTAQKIFFSTKLVEERTNREIKNAAVVQCEYSMFKNQNSRYCLIADIPEKRKKYILKLFAKNKHSSEDNDSTYPFLTEFLVIREGDEESYIPQYNLSFAHDIKLKSHYCQFIKFKTNPLVMEFEVPKHIKTLFSVKTLDDIKIEDTVISQINPENFKTIVQVAVPRKGEKFLLKIFAKHVRDQGNMFGSEDFVSQILLIRTQSNQNDSLTFSRLYNRGENCYIYSPIEYYLSSYNFIYEFKYYIKDALDVALVDSSQKWIDLDRLNQDPNVWVLNTALTTRGKLTLFAKFDQNRSFDGICYYEVK